MRLIRVNQLRKWRMKEIEQVNRWDAANSPSLTSRKKSVSNCSGEPEDDSKRDREFSQT